eukprot:TRINITY_DN76454_c0_g1_i1.p1 TRINITY_DN76454_c0_g1~~TRINITY_DN76454_c0_g1_i1.p1  ORF type:complete len:302 (+),score=32.53 TRINITY_DN76454_c0_g1_i1:69-974(+)
MAAGAGREDMPHFMKLAQRASRDALVDDWSCARGPPKNNPDALPGLRYGASREIRPRLVILPCPCAGGQWNKPWSDSGGVLEPSGLWANWKTPDLETDHQTASSSTSSSSSAGLPSSSPSSSDVGSKQNEEATSFGMLTNAIKSVISDGDVRPGSEPYSADYSCAQGIQKPSLPPFMSEIYPGKRWSFQPDHSTLVVATPCPCALGSYTGLQPKLQKEMAKIIAAEKTEILDSGNAHNTQLPPLGLEGLERTDDGGALGPPFVPQWQQQEQLVNTYMSSLSSLVLMLEGRCRWRRRDASFL